MPLIAHEAAIATKTTKPSMTGLAACWERA